MPNVTLRWTPRFIGNRQLVYRSTSPIDITSPPAALAVVDASASSYVDETVVEGNTYYYVVGAENNESPADIAFSNQVSVFATPVEGGGGSGVVSSGGGGGDLEAGYQANFRVRLLWTNATGGIEAGEIEMFDIPSGGEDITSVSNAIGGTNFGGAFDETQAFDDDTTSYYGTSTASAKSGDAWVGQAFGDPVNIQQFSFQCTDGDTASAPLAISWEYSEDGYNWTIQKVFAGLSFTSGVKQLFDPALVEPRGENDFYFWRILFTSAGTFDGGALTEVEMYEDVSGPNIATGGTPISGSEAFGGTDEQLFDGNKTTSFWAGASGAIAAGTSWVGYIFDETPVNIVAFELTARSGSNSNQMPDAFTLQRSEDGLTWEDVASFSDPASWASNESRVYTV